MATYYLDYKLGNDANAGDSFAAGHPWKTLTTGATAARIAPGDIIKIARSPAPTALAGTTATWTNLSKTVTLNAAETLEISDCDTDWSVTGVHGTSAIASASDWKEGTKKVSVVNAAAPNADEIQAFFATGTIAAATIADYQGITFWIKNEVAILENQWEVNLCSDIGGTTSVDVFPIPAIPSTGKWIPLTIFRNGGGNLGGGGDIKSINLSLGSSATVATASKYVYIDNINACKTGGLNLQSLISKNSLEQGGTEGWFGIQSIVGVTVLLDNTTQTLANAGRGYSGASGSANTYIRETIKTALASSSSTAIQEVKDSGTVGNNIQFQAGYNTDTGEQTGETFFDGLNGNGYGIYASSKNYITLNYLNCVRYNYGFYLSSSTYHTFTTISNANNNTTYGINMGSCNNNTIATISNANNNGSDGFDITGDNNIITTISNTNSNNSIGLNFGGNHNTITTFSNINNNTNYGILYGGNNNLITTISNVNNNSGVGVQFSTNGNTITTVSNANSNGEHGIYFGSGFDNKIGSLSTTGNGISAINNFYGIGYINNATIAESTKVADFGSFTDSKVYINKLGGTYSKIFTDGGTIESRASTLTHGSGKEWLFTTMTNTNRSLTPNNYPLTLSLAKIAVTANNAVTVTCYCKKGHATNIGARLVCRVGQLAWSDGTENIYDEKANDINEEQLSISFTPTESGVIEIEGWAYYITGHSTVIFDALTITQA